MVTNLNSLRITILYTDGDQLVMRKVEVLLTILPLLPTSCLRVKTEKYRITFYNNWPYSQQADICRHSLLQSVTLRRPKGPEACGTTFQQGNRTSGKATIFFIFDRNAE
jgi:hypothetical protein